LKKFWQFKNVAPGAVELLLYGEIKSERSWLDDEGGVYADEFVSDLQALGNVSQITCRINSPGGDIFAAVAIYTQLKTHSAKVIAIIDGIAASAATFPLMAADEIQMPNGASVMIHDPLAGLQGLYKAEELIKHANALKVIKDNIVSIYVGRTGISKSKLIDMMSEETWMTADEALANGFCDTIIGQLKASMKGNVLFVNKVEHDLSRFKKLPSVMAFQGQTDAQRTAFGERIAAYANKKLGQGTTQYQDTSAGTSREAMGAKIAEYANKKISGR
jgi:ATP-dependent Clp endopeptidase proteolytic subunit ClpP